MPGPADYCTTADIASYMPSAVPAEENPIWGSFISAASRAQDDFTDRYFYTDPAGAGTKYFDVDGDPDGDTPVRVFQMTKHDFFGLTALKIALIENGDPNLATDWIQLTGDGITPPSDFFLEPANETYVGLAGNAQIKPFGRIELPRTPPRTSSTFQDRFMVGKRTLAITATGWGWPAVPDVIKNITCKAVVRMWKAKESGWTGAVGSPDMNEVIIKTFLDTDDLFALGRFKRQSFA